MQLAQLNIAEALYQTDDPRMNGFTSRIEAVNAIADRSPGFVWRLVDDEEADDALSLRMEGEGDYTLVNMSVWKDIQSLFQFVYKTAHAKVMQNKQEWFEDMPRAHMVLWWVEDGHTPDIHEAKLKLDMLREKGPSPNAFTFNVPFDEDGQPITPDFPKKDCA